MTLVFTFLHEQGEMKKTQINRSKIYSNEQEISVFFLQGLKTQFTLTIDVGTDKINTFKSVNKIAEFWCSVILSPLRCAKRLEER